MELTKKGKGHGQGKDEDRKKMGKENKQRFGMNKER